MTLRPWGMLLLLAATEVLLGSCGSSAITAPKQSANAITSGVSDLRQGSMQIEAYHTTDTLFANLPWPTRMTVQYRNGFYHVEFQGRSQSGGPSPGVEAGAGYHCSIALSNHAGMSRWFGLSPDETVAVDLYTEPFPYERTDRGFRFNAPADLAPGATYWVMYLQPLGGYETCGYDSWPCTPMMRVLGEVEGGPWQLSRR